MGIGSETKHSHESKIDGEGSSDDKHVKNDAAMNGTVCTAD